MELVMIKLKHVSTLFILMLSGLYAQAQAEYDVRFLNTVGCDDSTLLVDIEVKAADGNAGFFMSEQNYRFSYNRIAIAQWVLHYILRTILRGLWILLPLII